MKVKNKKGMTLIELCVAFAILGIVSIPLLTLFTQGFISVTRAGNISKAGFNTQTQVEQALNGSYTPPSNPSLLTIKFSDNTTIILDADTYGYISSQTTSPIVNGSQSTITFFKPKN